MKLTFLFANNQCKLISRFIYHQSETRFNDIFDLDWFSRENICKCFQFDEFLCESNEKANVLFSQIFLNCNFSDKIR